MAFDRFGDRDDLDHVFTAFWYLANGKPYDPYLPPSETLPPGSRT
jgi:hypothetical protein